MTHGKNSRRFDVNDIKRAANGRWLELLPAITGIESDKLNGTGKPCPKCGGEDRFAAFSNVADVGGVLCRHCHNAETKPKSGDGIAAVQWLADYTFPEALERIAEAVGIAPVDPANDTRDVIGDLCKQKNMPADSAKAYGAATATRGNQRVVRFPVHGADGLPISSLDVSPYATGKLNKGLLPKGSKSGLFLPGRCPAAGETWLLVEGVKDAAALHGLGFNAAGMSGCKLLKGFEKLFTGCDVVLVPDLDRPAFRDAIPNGKALETAATSVRFARLPGEVKHKSGDDVRDVIAERGPDAVNAAIHSAETFNADALADRPTVAIDVETPEIEVTNAVIRIIGNRGFDSDDTQNRIYQRGGKLVCIADPGTGLKLIALTTAAIRERITAAMDLVSGEDSDDGPRYNRPPKWLTQAIFDRPVYDHVRFLELIVTCPTLRADGSVLQTPGYDAASRLVYVPDGDYPTIKLNPTQAEAIAAANELLAVVVDFPFKTDAAKSVWLAMVLTLLARSAIDGCCPMFCFSANVPGSGKSKLCDIAGLIVYGRSMARKTLPRDDEETRKVITSVVMEAKPAVLFDNVAAMIGNASLDAALTSPTWNDRILGKSETTGELPLSTVFMATGNNLSFKADIARRLMLCELESMHENPEDRTGFAHENIEAHTLKLRRSLAVAGLTVLRAFIAADRPFDGNRLGSYESWSELVTGAIRWVGLADPMATVAVVREQDTSGDELRLLLDGLEPADEGLKSADVVAILKDEQSDTSGDYPGTESLKAAFANLDKPNTRRVGAMLKKYSGRVSGGRRIVNKPGRSRVKLWTVERIATACDVETVEQAEPIQTRDDHGFDAGVCDDCGAALIGTPTADGYLNRRCDRCGTDKPCLPIDDPAAIMPAETQAATTQTAFV